MERAEEVANGLISFLGSPLTGQRQILFRKHWESEFYRIWDLLKHGVLKRLYQGHFYDSLTCIGENVTPATDTAPQLAWYSTISLWSPAQLLKTVVSKVGSSMKLTKYLNLLAMLDHISPYQDCLHLKSTLFTVKRRNSPGSFAPLLSSLVVK